jgi:sugar/nucleoside kinase (ribokinase family)
MIGLVGQSVLDRTRWPDGRLVERLGGSPIFAARAVADAWPAIVLTQGGDAALRRPLHGLGLEVVEGPPRRTTVFDVELFPDGSWTEEIVELGDAFRPEDVSAWMRPVERCSTVVCGTVWRDDLPAETLERLAAGGRRVFLDGQGMTRPRRLGPIRPEGPLNLRSLDHVDVLKLDEAEAEAMLGGVELEAARATGVPVVVVTLGERGAVVLTEGRAVEIHVDPVHGLPDTVGAGDAFLALMAAATESGLGPLEAADSACQAVALMLRSRLASGVEAVPR